MCLSPLFVCTKQEGVLVGCRMDGENGTVGRMGEDEELREG